MPVMSTDPTTHPPALFVQLLAEHQRAISAFIASVTPSRTDADDILQETCIALWKKWDEYDVNRDFFRWACGIAHFEVLRHRRKSATDRLWFDDDILQLLSFQLIEQGNLFDLRREALDSCIEKLAVADRALLEMRYRQDMTIEKLADSLGKTTRTIHRMVARIRRLLHHCIDVTVKNWDTSRT